MMSKQPKYQVKYGGWSTDYIIADADELEKLYYAKSIGAFFSGKYGGVDTTKITAIVPDYKETYGAAPEYELVGEDLAEIRAQFKCDIRDLIGRAETRAKYLVQNGRANEIGTGVQIPELDKPTTERREGTMKRLGEMPHTI